MSRRTNAWLKLSGIMGIFAPLVAFTCILLSISSYPSFSWTNNALSDLGVKNGITAAIFNCGLIASGILSLIFTISLFKFLREEAAGKLGALILASAAIALTSIGIFPEYTKQTHYYASVAFFVLVPVAMITITAALIRARKMKLGLFTLCAAIIAAAPWIIQFVSQYVQNVAIPETISALAAAAWLVVLGFKMLREVSTLH